MPSNDEIYNSMDPTNYLATNLEGDWYENYNNLVSQTAIPYYKVHTGQVFFIRNLRVEVMYTHEDIHPWAMNYFNNTSSVMRLTTLDTNGTGGIVPGSTPVSNMVLGDIQARASMVMRAAWGDYAKSDMVVTAHHGGTGCESELYQNIDAQIVLWSYSGAGALEYIGTSASDTTTQLVNQDWLSKTRWLYIVTGGTPSEDGTYTSVTLTIGTNGVAGMYQHLVTDNEETLAEKQAAGIEAFLGSLSGVQYNGSSATFQDSLTGITGTGDILAGKFTGGTHIFTRENMPTLELPVTEFVIEGEIGDRAEDLFDEGVAEFDVVL